MTDPISQTDPVDSSLDMGTCDHQASLVDEYASGGATALVIGESLIDIVPSPDGSVDHPGGSPMNTAVGLSRLGHPTLLATWIADDERGCVIARHLEDSHVVILPGSFSAQRTPTAEVVFDATGSAHYIFDLEWQMPTLPAGLAPLIVSTGSIGAVEPDGATGVLAAVERFHEVATIFFDPNIRPHIIPPVEVVRPMVEEYLRCADVVKASDEDLRWLYPDRDPLDSVEHWLTLGPSLVVLTGGAKGALGMTRTFQTRVPTSSTLVVDTVGAGDSFMAGLIHGMWMAGYVGAAQREDLPTLLTQDAVAKLLCLASASAAITLSRPGADPPWLAELPVSLV